MSSTIVSVFIILNHYKSKEKKPQCIKAQPSSEWCRTVACRNQSISEMPYCLPLGLVHDHNPMVYPQ